MAESAQTKESRKSVIDAVRTPLAFFTLGLLTFEGIILIVSSTVESAERVPLIWGSLILIFLTLVMVGVLAYTRSDHLFGVTRPAPAPAAQAAPVDAKPANRRVAYEVFVAAPMAGTADEAEYQETREMTLKVINSLKRVCSFHTIYFAGEKLSKKAEFEAPFFSAKKDFDALRESQFFVLILPKPILSSVIVEAGFALALNIPSVYFVRDRKDLPFMLREAPQVFPEEVLVHEYKSADDLLDQIEDAKLELFPKC
jgi:hypothetical protein